MAENVSDLNIDESQLRNNKDLMFLDDPAMYIKIHGSKKWHLFGYMEREKTWSPQVTYASFSTGIPATEVRRDVITQSFEFTGMMKQIQPETLAIIQNRLVITEANGQKRIAYGSEVSPFIYLSVDLIGKNVNGQAVRLRIRRLQMSAEEVEMTFGGDEHTGVEFTGIAQIDETPATTNPEWEYVGDSSVDAKKDNIAFMLFEGAAPDIEVKETSEIIDTAESVATGIIMQNKVPTISTEQQYANVTSGSTSIFTDTTAKMKVGMKVSGTGIPAGATISSITDDKNFVISAAATASGIDIALTIIDVVDYGSNDYPTIHKKTFTITNRGDATLTLTGTGDAVAVSGGDSSYFVVTQPAETSLEQGESTTFVITFTADGTPATHDDATILIENNTVMDPNFTFDLEAIETT